VACLQGGLCEGGQTEHNAAALLPQAQDKSGGIV